MVDDRGEPGGAEDSRAEGEDSAAAATEDACAGRPICVPTARIPAEGSRAITVASNHVVKALVHRPVPAPTSRSGSSPGWRGGAEDRAPGFELLERDLPTDPVPAGLSVVIDPHRPQLVPKPSRAARLGEKAISPEPGRLS